MQRYRVSTGRVCRATPSIVLQCSKSDMLLAVFQTWITKLGPSVLDGGNGREEWTGRNVTQTLAAFLKVGGGQKDRRTERLKAEGQKDKQKERQKDKSTKGQKMEGWKMEGQKDRRTEGQKHRRT